MVPIALVAVFALLAQRDPIVVEVMKQPPVTPQITIGEVVLSAVGLIGAIIIAALVLGAIVGAIVVLRKRRSPPPLPSSDAGHSLLGG